MWKDSTYVTLFTRSTYILASYIALLSMAGTVTSTSMEEYFPEIGDDLTKVTWGKAVNSKDELQQAFTDKLMMLEADVILGTLVGGSGDKIPVMALPPDNSSDLSLKAFLKTVVNATENGHRCGIKLDFKTIEALMPSLEELKSLQAQIKFPVMLNADILPGPVDSSTIPVDADSFLHLCVEMFPDSTLSVGWTTKYGGFVYNGSYSEEQVTKMEDALARNNVTQPVTFPVRAGLAARSANTLQRLKQNVANSTFTVWSSEFDAVDVDLLRSVILDTLGRDRVLVDVPEELSNQLNLTSKEPRTPFHKLCPSCLDCLRHYLQRYCINLEDIFKEV